jgi:hypothetical protein
MAEPSVRPAPGIEHAVGALQRVVERATRP